MNPATFRYFADTCNCVLVAAPAFDFVAGATVAPKDATEITEQEFATLQLAYSQHPPETVARAAMEITPAVQIPGRSEPLLAAITAPEPWPDYISRLTALIKS